MSGPDLPGDDSRHPPHHPPAGWDQAAARYLVSCAARKAPSDLAARLEEEWLADLMTRRGAFSRIGFGLGCCWATRIIAHEFGSAAVAAGGSASGQRLLVSYGGYDFSRLSRRTVALIAIICLHAVVFYAYVSGLAQRIVDKPTPRLDTSFIIRRRTVNEPLPLAPLTLTPTVLNRVPRPDFQPLVPAQPNPITVAHTAAPAVPTPSRPTPVGLVTGGPGAGFPNTGDYYPADARRLEETGSAAVRVCVDSRGSLTADPAIVQSSGFARLDQGALKLARAGSGHYRPTMENGRPIAACYAFRIRFQLEDR